MVKIEVKLGGDCIFEKILIKKLCSFNAYFENESTSQKWKHISEMKAMSENESTFREWKHVLKMKAHFETVQAGSYFLFQIPCVCVLKQNNWEMSRKVHKSQFSSDTFSHLDLF